MYLGEFEINGLKNYWTDFCVVFCEMVNIVQSWCKAIKIL